MVNWSVTMQTVVTWNYILKLPG